MRLRAPGSVPRRRWEMSSVSHPPVDVVPERWAARLLVREMWASVAIVAMWIAVAVTAIWGADFVSSNAAGTNSTTIPSAIAVAVFASVGTWAVAKRGFGHDREE
jgi:hypothetical protein